MSAVLTTHRCPYCATEVVVYAKEATVYHRCKSAPLKSKMVTFQTEPVKVLHD